MKIEEQLTLTIDLLELQLKDSFEVRNLLLEQSERLRKALELIGEQARIPDGEDACLLILKTVRETLKDNILNEAFNGKVFETCDSVGMTAQDPIIETFESEVEYLKALVGKLDRKCLDFEDVLKFYADENNYRSFVRRDGCTISKLIIEDHGKRAREVLGRE